MERRSWSPMRHDDLREEMTRRNALATLGGMALALVGVRGSAQQTKQPAGKPWDDKMEVAIGVEIAQIDDFRARRPYVAVWIEDKEGKPVRTICLWAMTRGRGPRWIPDLRRWYRYAYDVWAATKLDLVVTRSSATRSAGTYSVVWNGTDDKDKPVQQGTYSVCIEASREHGTHQLIRKEVEIAGKPFKVDVAGGIEIKGATVEYRKRK